MFNRLKFVYLVNNYFMAYFNYHAKAKQLIKDGHLLYCKFYKKWNKIENCFVLFFDNHNPMPIREERIGEYKSFLK